MIYKFFIIFLAVTSVVTEKVSYNDHKVLKIIPKNEDTVEVLKDIRSSGLGEFWDEAIQVNKKVKLNVAPHKYKAVQDKLKNNAIEYEVVFNDMQKIIDQQQMPARNTTGENFLDFTWDRYHNLAQIYAWLDRVYAAYPNVVNLTSMGPSVDGREIKGIIINYKPNNANKSIGMLEGTLHAREWISPATVTWIIKEFLTSTDPAVRALAEDLEWHIFPVVNPDGYVYSFEHRRMWRKNRSRANFTSCAHLQTEDDMSNGVDLNRNFDFVWMSIGASNDSCSNTFAGPIPFSEPESRAIAQRVLTLKDEGRFIYYIAVHSYTQLFVIPYSHVSGVDVLLANNYADMYEIAIRGSEALSKRFGTKYRVGVSADVMYPMSGTSFDWVKFAADVPISFLIELRDLGEYGFLLPPEQIIPTGLETMDAFIEMDRTTRLLGYYVCLEVKMNYKQIFLLIPLISISAEYVSYENHKVYKIIPSSDKEVQILVDLQKQNEYFFWSDIIDISSDVRVMVAPGRQEEFEDYLFSVGITPKIVIEDVKRSIENQLRRPTQTSRNSADYAWDYYQTLDEITDWLRKIAEEYSDIVTLVNIGRTVEGRDIVGVKINYKDSPTLGMIEGGIHAREWISPATVTWIIKEFLTSNDPEVRALAENIVWHIFPVVNPDGYAYTFTNNRMWRKNRNPLNHTSCGQWGLSDDMSNGIDLNRNFGFVWMTVGASQNPCAETYAGPVPFSEFEALAIANYVGEIQTQGNLVFYYAFHSYSQMVLVPYSHVGGADVLDADNYGDMYEIAIKGMDKLRGLYGTDYIVGTSKDILYEVSGSSFDWVKGGANVPIVYLFELRDIGEFGFLLPPELIISNNEEIVAGLVEMDRVARQIGYYTSSGEKVILSTLLCVLFLILAL
ncbi:hypothetical protein K1T71_010644 [Dendrolimus kikuchii]|uniref:Uncharacterized protein n=1 Tax=Dendrolimus kikuchii TaxID=765133 RepID=A0ACC1CPG2_9NEOP|nr:hypothetical protein K1T71_010644 [Dendrolimus kikuchii]